MPRCIPSWMPFSDRFLIDFCSQLGPPDPEKSSPRFSQSTILEKSPFQVNINFWFHFGANLPLFWHQKSNKFRPNIDPKTHQKNDRVWDRFFWPSWLHLGSQVGARLAPFSPKVGRCCGVLPSSLFRCFFYPTFSWFWPRLCTNLARFWRLWTPSGRVAGPIFVFVWCQVGAILGQLDTTKVLDEI